MSAPTIPADWSAVVSPLLDAIEERRRSTALVGLFGSAKGLVLSVLTAVYLATLGPDTVVHQIIVDRLGADW